jgi:hypothetical protein
MSELIGNFQLYGRTYLRDDESGRFLSAAHAGAAAASNELAETLAEFVRAGIAAQTRTRTGRLLASVNAIRLGASESGVVVEADYGAPLDRGAVAHWIPNAFGRGVPVWHPGNKPPLHFMDEAARAMIAVSGEIVRRNMP